VPELFRKKFEAIRERFRAAPFFVHVIYTREDEFDIASRLDDVAARHSDVDIGSYPTFTNQDYKVKITLESKAQDSLERARDQLLQLLDAASIARTE
jgi:molybdopterin-biosynthesis enzyme MoeA-like protein